MMRLKRTIDSLTRRLAPRATGPGVELWLPPDGTEADIPEPSEDFCPRPGEPRIVEHDVDDLGWSEFWPPAAPSPEVGFPFPKPDQATSLASGGQIGPNVAQARAGVVPVHPETGPIVPGHAGETPNAVTAVKHDGDTGVPTTPPSPPPIPVAVERPNPFHNYLVAVAVSRLRPYGE